MKSAEVVKKTTTKFHKSLITMASFTICNDEDITLNPNPRVGKLTLMTEDDDCTSKIDDDNIEDFIDDLDNESPITSLPVGDWRNKVLSAETKDFFANQWIKVPLRTNFRPELNHLNYNHQLSDNSGKEEPRRSIHRKVLPLIGFLLCSIGITGAFVAFFVLVVNADEAMTSSGVATLQISLNSSLTAQLKDWRTAERQQFDKDFCSSMITIFKSTKGPVKDRSPVCRVKRLRYVLTTCK
ncbi:uncharacterized protein [Argopecten irradians]|uniref:uncharacterized protein n=1 Tax=Argopecten irradians TaxID=31199 RepID=UPI003713E262